ncbi:MFS transporter [Nocardia harenae]|uniref:MFS transporter n=1 Tax=Nocardia harenae TaxID=358707 RepID=UPI0008299209|nr:MFS transporter [Nocardia harenae]
MRTETIDRNTAAPLGRGRRIAAVIVICLAELLVVLDNTIVNVALPSIGVQTGATMSGLQWIVDAYTLTFAGLLLAFGHLGDRHGRRRAMVIGLAGIAVMSLGGALATGLGQLVAARAAMGICAAAVFPATLALIINLLPRGRERAAGIAAWTAMAGFAIAIGPTAGGWLLETFTWHAVFWINVPAALAVAAAALALVPESRVAHSGRLDITGIALSLTGITILVATIIEAPRYGWTAPITLTGYTVAALVLAAFVWWETRVTAPVLDIRLFTIRRFSLPALAIAVAYFSMFGFLFMITQYFQAVREYSPLEFGIHSLPFAAAVALGAPVATLAAQRLGATAVIVTGLLVLAAGMYIAGQVTVDSPYLGAVLVSMVVMGLGLAVVQGPATDSIMASVPEDQAGAGSAVNDTTRELGGTLGVAILGSILGSVYTGRIGPRIDAVPDALMNTAQKDIARHTGLAVLEINKPEVAPLFATQKAELVRAMKIASMDGFHTASWVTVTAVTLTAVVVAALMPWKPAATALLAWQRTPPRHDDADPGPADLAARPASPPAAARAWHP